MAQTIKGHLSGNSHRAANLGRNHRKGHISDVYQFLLGSPKTKCDLQRTSVQIAQLIPELCSF